VIDVWLMARSKAGRSRARGFSILALGLACAGSGCCKQESQGVAVKNAAELIDKEAEFAEFQLTKCKAQDAAGCDDVAKRLAAIRSTAADLKALNEKK
jgi:hypothetical protein